MKTKKRRKRLNSRGTSSSIIYQHTIIYDGTESNIERLSDLLETGVYFGKLDWLRLVVDGYYTLSIIMESKEIFSQTYLKAFKSLAMITDVNLGILYRTNKNSKAVTLIDFVCDEVDLDSVEIVGSGDFDLDNI